MPGPSATSRAAAVLVAAALVGVGCAPGESGRRLPEGTPVVLISIDTLRSDRLPVYGYDRVDTPAIDGLRRDGILYRRAYTQVPLTLPSHVSLLTGLLPPEHGVRDNLGFTVNAGATPMLQHRLRAAGYATGGAVSAFVLRGATGVAAGFDRFDDDIELAADGHGPGIQAVQRPGGETLDAIVPWLRSVAGAPFFLFFHIFEPHTPYAPPPELAARYEDPYDGEVAAADAIVGRLLTELEALDAFDRALIILLADHGEGLGDHGEDEHGVFLYRSTLQVPLIIKLPGGDRAGEEVDEPVQLIDVVPTVVDALGLEPDDRLTGRSLLDPAGSPGDRRPIFAETMFPRLHFGWSDLGSVIVGRHQLIDAPSPELYDLIADQDQVDNLVRRQPDLEASLRTFLADYDRTPPEPAAVDPETRSNLQALGYIGEASITDDAALPDPKSRIGVLGEIRRAHRSFAAGDFETAATSFRSIVDAEPGIEDAWEYLALAEIALGRPEAAAETYRRALRAAPHSTKLAMRAAILFARLGRFDEAALQAERATTYDPAAAHGLLAQIAFRRGDLDAAEDEARAAIAVPGDLRPGGWLILADVVAVRGDPAAAADELDRALDEGLAEPELCARLATLRLELGQPDLADTALRRCRPADDPAISLVRGELALARRSWADARESFERTLEAEPGHPVATLKLGLLDAAEGHDTEASTRLEAALAELPTSFEGWNALGMVRARRGDDAGAIDAWSRAHQLRPEVADVLFNLGLANAQAGRRSRAAELLEEYAARAEPGPQRDRAMALAIQLRGSG